MIPGEETLLAAGFIDRYLRSFAKILLAVAKRLRVRSESRSDPVTERTKGESTRICETSGLVLLSRSGIFGWSVDIRCHTGVVDGE